jgi:hypothetical protein
MERLYADRKIGRPDLNRVYGGAFLSFHTYVERSLERLFLGVLMGRFTAPGVTPLVAIKSEVVARAVVSGGKKYVDWLPFERHAQARAIAFLASGKPFTDVEKVDARVLDRLGIVRNAIAHESSHALRMFRRTFVDGKALPPDQQTPAGYLRGQHSPGLTRFANTINETVVVFGKLCMK